MKNSFRIVTLLALVAIAGAALAAGTVVGTWKGKISIDRSKAPKPTNPQQQKSMDAGLATVAKMQIVLNLKGNKTYSVEAKNVPGKTANQKSEGTWKQEGTTLWLTAVTDNGKPAVDKKPQKFLVLEGGKKLSLATADMPPFISVIFTR